MDIMRIIEDYVSISVKWKRLSDLKRIEEQYEAAALAGSRDMSYASSQKMRRDFLKKANLHFEKIRSLKKELARVEQALEHSHLIYSTAVDAMNYDALVSLLNRLLTKVDELTIEQKEPEKSVSDNTQKADIAFRNRRYEEQIKLNEIASAAYIQSQDLLDSLEIYHQIVNIIEMKKNNMRFSSNNSNVGYGI